MANRSVEVNPAQKEEDVVASPPPQPGVKQLDSSNAEIGQNRGRILQDFDQNCAKPEDTQRLRIASDKEVVEVDLHIGDDNAEKGAGPEPELDNNKKKEEPAKEEQLTKEVLPKDDEAKKELLNEEDLDELD